ncbi:outer membrane beta-barrel protein [Sphingobacterium thalpophilum]|uniref:outer membrane beta-barrel protein n=1 Tax=Sphingobacterium thalpophilum TaxID=259 RepID=UPI0024A77A07|nr:outer membrane beta-barrel protein [Sphingobacterium thalpophilum]
MNKLNYISLILLLPITVLAQQKKNLSGRVVDEQGQPLSYVTVIAREGTKHVITNSTITDEKGIYQLSTATADSVYLEVKMLGFITKNIAISTNQSTVAQDLVLTTDPNVLNEVVVQARRNKITRKTDRLVINVEQNAAFAGRPSLALFSTLPGVFVQNGQISVNGVYGTRVMLNGRLLKLTGDDLNNYLETIKADEIKEIEVIAHPPAEYDAEGTGGLINIILKANRKFGLTARVGSDLSMGLGKYPSYRPSLGVDLRKGKFNFSGSYSYAWTKSFETIKQERKVSNNGNYISENNAIDTTSNQNIRFATTYDINDRHFMAIDYRGTYRDDKYNINSLSTTTYPDIEQSTRSIGNFPSSSKNSYSNIGFNYEWKTDSLGSKLSFVSDYTYRDSRGKSMTTSETYGHQGALLSDTTFTFFYPSISNIFTGELKYNWKFKSGESLTFGGKYSNTDIKNKNSYAYENANDRESAFDYNYQESIGAGFVALNGSLFKIDYNLGLRGEHSDIKGDLTGSQDTSVHSSYFNLFPNLSLQRTLDENGENILTLAYSKRIARPSFQQLNPFKYYIDNFTVQTGNPYLTPQFQHAVELNYLFQQKYYAAVSYTKIDDVINQVIETDETSGIMTVLRKNSGVNKVLTATFSIPVQIAKWWSMTNNLLLTHTESLAPEFSLKKNSFVFQTEQNITLPRDWSLTINGFYTPRVLTGNIVTGSMATVDFGVRKQLLNKKLSVNANISDIFYTNNFTAASYFNKDIIHIRKKEQSRIATISLLYNFNIGEVFKTRKIDKSNTDEKERL